MAKRGNIDSIQIKNKLQELFPDFKFSVTRNDFAGGHSVRIVILEGNIKGYNSEDNLYDITDEMKAFVKKVEDVANEVGGGYNQTHGYGSAYLGVKVGTYAKPYVYNQSKGGGSSYRGYGRRSAKTYEWGELITECAGWKLYKKPFKETFVYNLVKDKETAPNRQNWNEIRGYITTQEGFKWTPKTQTFSKWGEIKDIKTTSDNLCRILGQYYQGATPSEPTPMPEPEPTPIPEEPKSKPLLTNQEVIDITNALEKIDGEVWDELGITSGGKLYNDESLQQQYVIKLGRMIDMHMNKDLWFLFKNASEEAKEKVFRSIGNDNYHSLNNFLGLSGWYGETTRKDYIDSYEQFKNQKFKGVLNPAYFTNPTEPTPSSILRDITDEEARDFAERMAYAEGDIWGKLDISSGAVIRMNKEKQDEYVKMMLTALNNRIERYFPYIPTIINVKSLKKIYDIFQDENQHLLNNFLGLAGFYGETIKQEYIDLYNRTPNYFLTPFSTKTQEPQSSSIDRESIEKKVKALALVFKYAKTDEEKKVVENKINALKIILKYKK